MPAPFLVNGYAIIWFRAVQVECLDRAGAVVPVVHVGVCVVAAIIARLHWVKVMVIFAGLLCMMVGLAIVVAFAVLTAIRQARRLRSYAVPGIVLCADVRHHVGQAITGRLTEVGSSRSSTSLRTIEPYQPVADVDVGRPRYR